MANSAAPNPAPTPQGFAVGAKQVSVPHVKVFNPGERNRFSFYACDVGTSAAFGWRRRMRPRTGTRTSSPTPPTRQVRDVRQAHQSQGVIVLQHTRVTAGIFVVSGHLNGDGKAKAQSMRTPGKCEHFDGATGAPLANFRRSRSWAGRG